MKLKSSRWAKAVGVLAAVTMCAAGNTTAASAQQRFHDVHIVLKSVMVHQDGDSGVDPNALKSGCGEISSLFWVHTAKYNYFTGAVTTGTSESLAGFEGVHSWCEGTSLPLAQPESPNSEGNYINRLIMNESKQQPGDDVDFYVDAFEIDQSTFINSGPTLTDVEKNVHLTVPAPGEFQDFPVVLSTETVNGTLLVQYNFRIRTF